MGASVTFVLDDLRRGGAERVVVRWANWFAARGHDVELVTLTASGPLEAEVGASVRRATLGAPRVARSVPVLVRHLRRRRPDVVVATLPHVNVAVATATALAAPRARLVLREANDPVAEHPFAGLAGAARRRLVRWAYGRAAAVVALTHGNAEAVVAHLGARPERVHVIPNPAPAVADGRVAAADGPEGRPRFVCVARLARQKDHATLLEALVRLPGAALALVGDGPLRGALEDRVAALGLTARVRFVGDVADVGPWWAWADVAVLSSRWEGFPNVLLEALAHGVPVVATDCPTGPREVIGAAGDVGALVPVAAPDALAAALARVAAAPPSAAALRARALEFDLDALGARWLEVCGLAASPGAP